MSKTNATNDESGATKALDTAAGYAEEALRKLEDGHIFASAAWKLIHKKSEMGDIDWIREVGKEAIRMAYEETFMHNDQEEARDQ